MKVATLFLAFLTISGVFGNQCFGGSGHVEHRSRVDKDNNMFMDRLARAVRDSISSKIHIAQLYPHLIRGTRELLPTRLITKKTKADVKKRAPSPVMCLKC